MARKLRTSAAGIPQLVQRCSKPNLVVFKDDDDRQGYLNALLKYAGRYFVDLHAWSILNHELLLLCTPGDKDSLSQMLQATGRLYVPYYNQKYQQAGGIWQDRFKSSLILDDDHLLATYRFVEQAPVRAGLVKNATDYTWSSARQNAGAENNMDVVPHPSFLRLAGDEASVQAIYNQRLKVSQPEADNKIAQALKKGHALGDSQFIQRLEKVTGRRLSAGKRGRPPKTVTPDQ